MTAALVVAVLVALVCAAGWEQAHRRQKETRHWADYFKQQRDGWVDAVHKAEETQEAVGTALAKVWHHITPASPEEGAAVAVLRNAFPELPVPAARWNGRQGPECADCPSRGDFETLCCRGDGILLAGGPPHSCGAGAEECPTCSRPGEDFEAVGCGTFLNLPAAGLSWPQCECLRFNPPGAESCARCGATPPKPRARRDTPVPDVQPLKEEP